MIPNPFANPTISNPVNYTYKFTGRPSPLVGASRIYPIMEQKPPINSKNCLLIYLFKNIGKRIKLSMYPTKANDSKIAAIDSFTS